MLFHDLNDQGVSSKQQEQQLKKHESQYRDCREYDVKHVDMDMSSANPHSVPVV